MGNERRAWFLGPDFCIIAGATSVHICCDDGYIYVVTFNQPTSDDSVLPLKYMLFSGSLPK